MTYPTDRKLIEKARGGPCLNNYFIESLADALERALDRLELAERSKLDLASLIRALCAYPGSAQAKDRA